MAKTQPTQTTKPAPARTVVKPQVAKPGAKAPAPKAPAPKAANGGAAPAARSAGQTAAPSSVNNGVIRADLHLTLTDGSVFRLTLPNATLISPALGTKTVTRAAAPPPTEEIENVEPDAQDELVDEGVEGIVDESGEGELPGEELEIEDENEGEDLDAELAGDEVEGELAGDAGDNGEEQAPSCGIDLTPYGDAQLREFLKQADVKGDAAGTPIAKLKTAALRRLVDENCEFTPQE